MTGNGRTGSVPPAGGGAAVGGGTGVGGGEGVDGGTGPGGAGAPGQRPVVVAALAWAPRRAEVDPLTGAVHTDPHDHGPSPAELAALEHALRLAALWNGYVVAATVGGPEAEPMLREALAAGADAVLRVAPAGAAGHPADLIGADRRRAASLATALRARYGVPALVLCGDASRPAATGSFPAFLAAELAAEQALGVVRLEPGERPATVVVHRRLEAGRRELLRVSAPAVVSVEAAGVRLRRACLPAVLAHTGEPIPVAIGAAPAPIPVRGSHPYRPRPRHLPAPTGPPLRRVRELTGALAPRDARTVVGPLPAPEAAEALLAYLRGHGYLPDPQS
jgi:electron transfer flavoprotein beta subunit